MEENLSKLIEKLPPKARSGSKPRCHLLTHGATAAVAARLSELIAPHGEVLDSNHWMPQGFENLKEAQLHRRSLLLEQETSDQLKSWWLKHSANNPRTPNWDIASQCVINGKRGLLLVEAKAHRAELYCKKARLKSNASRNSQENHAGIEACIKEANRGLAEMTNLTWGLSHDKCYQLSNRFAWAWKLASLGTPVILLYLGFLNTNEMSDAFATDADWRKRVLDHGKNIVPPSAWDTKWNCGATALIPLIKSLSTPLG